MEGAQPVEVSRMQETNLTDAMKLIGAQTASWVVGSRERRRREQDGWLVPPPCPLSELADARMIEPNPGETAMQPNAALRVVRDWLRETFEAGGNADDLRKAWLAWPTHHPAHLAKSALVNEYEALLKRARLREVELSAKACREQEPERTLGAARAQLALADHRATQRREDLATARANLTRAQ